MCSLELNKAVPTKPRDPEAAKLLEASLTVSKAYSLFSFVVFGKHQKTEKHRDKGASPKIFHSASPYCLNAESKQAIMATDKEERNTYLIGLAKIIQQTVSYAVPGTAINHMCDKVLTIRYIHPLMT